MSEPIEDEYFNWLSAKVLQTNGNMHLELLRILHATQFVWIISGDRNRAEDGIELRIDFLRETHFKNEDVWYRQPCSVLEMLIGFSSRATFQTDIPERDWFWTFMTNLNLEQFRRVSKSDKPIIEDILNTFIWRTYDPSGHGGMFPMRWPKHDQREVEVWYQFCAFLEDQGLI